MAHIKLMQRYRDISNLNPIVSSVSKIAYVEIVWDFRIYHKIARDERALSRYSKLPFSIGKGKSDVHIEYLFLSGAEVETVIAWV